MVLVKDLILSTVGRCCNKTDLKFHDNSEYVLSDFINNSQTLLIQAFVDNNELHLSNKIQKNETKSIIFYKTSALELIHDDSSKDVNIITLSSSAAESLYQILKKVYTPLLAEGDNLHSTKLQKHLSDLESVLRILSYGKGTDNTNVILSIDDELEYWKTFQEKKEVSKKEREAAETFSELFEDIAQELRTMQSSAMTEIRESAENIGGILDDVWRTTLCPYSQDRMIHMFDIIGHEICSVIQQKCSGVDLWVVHESKEFEVLSLLSDSLNVILTWTSACSSLTETYWPNYALHPWNGKPYVPLFCTNFQSRLKEINDIRSTHSQLNKLLTRNEQAELQTHLLFEPFHNINIWMCNGTNPAWEAAVLRFSADLRPAEMKIAEKLKPRLYNTSTKQMLYEFMRYQALIERPLVKQALNNELEIFVSSLVAMLKEVQKQLDADEVDVKMYQPPEMSPLVHQVQWAKQMEAKVKEIQMCADKYLREFEGSAKLLSLAAQILKDLKAMYTQLHEEWCRDLQVQAKNGELQLSLDKPVVEFSGASKLMVVRFNPRLAWLQLECRAMAALALPPPAAAAAPHAAPLVHARALQQVASFHNTLGERMIPSTRSMMLQAALDLSALVQDQKAVYWDDIQQLANYTEKLKKAVLKLETQNTYLTNQHIAIRNIVEKLIDTDLLAKQAEWKRAVKDIRNIIETVESNGYKNTDPWRLHWDWQLYKALECQYIKTLLSLHKHFPHVRVDLVLRGHAVQVQPPLEELRVQHYSALRRLVALPAQFVGLQNNIAHSQNIFAAIVDKHSWVGNSAVRAVEAALAGVARARAAWSVRAALACVPDLHALCTQHLTRPEHWENNFKACKAYGQAVAKMTFEDEKVEWISIGTATLRREFEAQTRALWACLMSSLQASCRDDAAALDAFVANATVMLDNKLMPKNAKELSDISAKQLALQEKLPEMEKLVEDLKKKGHLLRTWGGDTSVDRTIKDWQKTRELMLTQQQMFQHQAEVVKSSLSGEWEKLCACVEAWVSRCALGAARAGEARGAGYSQLRDNCRDVLHAATQWEEFQDNKNQLLQECEKFNMKIEVPEMWQQGEKLMKESLDLWSVFKEYDEEFETLAKQDWVVFQKKLHLLEEFTSKWKGLLEPYTSVTLVIQQELDKYSDLTPLLKYLRGSDFSERNWHEVFSLLEMEYKSPDTLQLIDFLNVAHNIKKHIKELQKICAVASNESAIRSALNELEIWFAGARLSIVYYSDKSKRQTPIVKDFKDILTKVSEQQWVVSSLGGGGGGGGADACAAWESRLRTARAALRATHHAQRRWLYLEPILSNDDGELGAKFRKVDQNFRQVTRILESDPRLSAILQSSRLQPMLDSILEQLTACQSALNQYIDEKRTIFPRLYFLSDDDLLELLGQARAGAEGREAVMQTHLKKLFPGTTGVRLGPGDMSITALCSHYGEILQLDHPVDIDCPVEVWLKNLESEMRSSLKNIALKCVVTLQEQDPFSLPTQILCLAQNIRFTERAERAINSKELHKLKTDVEKEHSHYATTEVEDESEQHKRQALILQCAHYTSVIKILINNNVSTVNDWLWQKQLRFYLQGNKEIVAKMGLAQIPYSYEYLGVNTGQFVRTELADECFLILTQSLHLGFVGNPFGPAGTGKTESVKALGGLFGRLVLIFNCDEGMDAECMGRLLSGLALCGAWGCFDEFNRLAAATLAAVSHQLADLLAAMQLCRTGAHATATLNGKTVAVSPWCGVAATLNPAGRGYGGRREVPGALARLLRPVAMLAPRARTLAHHLLAAHAVPRPDLLADQLHSVFQLASVVVSGARHYDWGLRALKAAVSSVAVSVRRAPARPERTARRLLALNNLSKLTAADAHRFQNILSLVFPDVSADESTPDPLESALEKSMESLKLVHNKLQVQKCVELHEQLQQRMGVALVGAPGSGKTTIRRLLKHALTQQGKNIVEYVISPKAMSREWLLGSIDHDTRQWTDGVISTAALEISNQPPDVWSWVVCDGDVEPEWVEALNSVLDDNRLLSLPSGWRVQFHSNVNFLFETHHLHHASPATVSRMAIILLGNEMSCDVDVLENWVRNAEYENDIIRAAVPLLQNTTKVCIKWLSTHKSDVALKLYNITVVKQIITQFEYIAQNVGLEATRITPEEVVNLAIERSVVGMLKESAVDNFRHETCTGWAGAGGADAGDSCAWWEALLVSRRVRAAEPAVRAALASHHLLLRGHSACAKSLLLEYVLKDSNTPIIFIDCTPILEPTDIIAELKRHNLVRSGGGGGGGGGAWRGTLVVRALHRAARDAWGCSALHAFLLQVMQQGGFWGLAGEEEGGGLQWWWCARVRVLATAAPAAHIHERLDAHMLQINLQEPDDEEMSELCSYYLKQNVNVSLPTKEISSLATKILAMFKEVTDTFHSQPHYNWNASHMKSWCENIKLYSPTNLEEIITAISVEANFVFRDRLVSDDEKAQFNNISRSHLQRDSECVYLACKSRPHGVFLDVIERKEWHHNTQKLINQCLSEHENIFGDTGAEACYELAVLLPAIARTCAGGAAVCVARAGSGRRAAAALAAACLPASLHLVEHAQHFNTQFKNALSVCAEGGRALVFVCAAARSRAVLARAEAAWRAPHAHALPHSLAHALPPNCSYAEIKKNLGVVICVEAGAEDACAVLEQVPALRDGALLVWLAGWARDTLHAMPTLIIDRLMKEKVTELTSEQLGAIPAEEFVKIYSNLEAESMRAPSRYVTFIKTYYHIVSKKISTLTQRRNMLTAGVEALKRARSDVAKLQEEAAEQEKTLSEKQAQANQALDQISATVQATTDKKEEMHALKKNIEIENEKLQIQKKEIEAELASVEPVIEAARAAVGDIRPEALSEVRSLRAPPDVVRDILEGVLRLMGIADTSWHSMKNFLSKRGVKEDIRCLDASTISAGALAEVERLLARRGASFSETAARRASAACAPLAAWVHANVRHARALAAVRPLQQHLQQLRKNLESAESSASALSAGLASVEQRVGVLKEQLRAHSRDAAALELRVQEATRTISSATQLLEQLAQEYTQWQAHLEEISKEIAELNMRSLLAAAYIVYLPELTEPQARDCIKKWSELIGYEDTSFTVLNFLSTTEKQLKWDAEGLPSDESAVKNAVFIDQYLEAQKCGLTPLLVDPEGEGLAWLKNTLSDKPCDFVSHASDNLLTAVQYAVRLQRVLVVTEVESVQEAWSGLLQGAGGAGGAGGVRLVLQCRDAGVAARLELHAPRLSTLHFTARLDGLTEQLIYHALQHHNPEINEKAKEVKIQEAALQKQQHELQESLLRELSSKAEIVGDAGVAACLAAARRAGGAAEAARAAARGVREARRAATAQFGGSARVAARAALAVRALARRYPRAALPLPALLHVYALATTPAPNQTNVNTDAIVKCVIRKIIDRVLLGLYKKDKYIVIMHLLKEVYGDLMPDNLWQLFIGNYAFSEDAKIINEIKTSYSWIPDECIKNVARLKVTSEDLFNKLSLNNEQLWKEFLHSGDLNIIGKLNLSPFETVVAVTMIRPESCYGATVAFANQMLGGAASGAVVARAAAWGARGVPVLLLAAHAADVLAAYAHAHKLYQVSAAEGAAGWARGVAAARGGGWLVLLLGASPFTPDLLAFLADLTQAPSEEFHEDFRLWIVSEDREIPRVVLNMCVNVVLEPPEGVKNNVMNTLSAWDSYEDDPEKVRAHAALALFHAIVQERRAYIPQGWSRWYAWEWGEAAAGARAVREGGARAGSALCAALYAARLAARADTALLHALHARAQQVAPRLHATRLQSYVAAFDNMTNMDSPEMLGLPDNCRIAWERNEAHHIITGLKELNSTVSVNRKGDNVAQVKSLLALWKKLMSASPLIKGDYTVDECGARGWWRGACSAEAAEAARAARGLHAALRALAAALAHPHAHVHAPHRVPEEWQLLWAGPEAPDEYLKEFCYRANAAVARLDACGQDPDFMPAEVDLRGWLRCARVCGAVRACAAERLQRPPHALLLRALPLPAGGGAGAGPVLRGLALCGAAWGGAGLRAAPPHSPPHCAAPPLLLRAVPAEDAAGAEGAEGAGGGVGAEELEVAVYSDAGRGEAVALARLPLERSFPRALAALHAVALHVAPVHDAHHTHAARST